MWLMLQQDEPDDYVIATGETHTVREFLDDRLRPRRARLAATYVEIDQRYFAPGRGGRALRRRRPRRSEKLGWEPTRRASSELVRIMVDADSPKLRTRTPAQRRSTLAT